MPVTNASLAVEKDRSLIVILVVYNNDGQAVPLPEKISTVHDTLRIQPILRTGLSTNITLVQDDCDVARSSTWDFVVAISSVIGTRHKVSPG